MYTQVSLHNYSKDTRVCVCVCVCVYVCVYVCVCERERERERVNVYTYINMCMYAYMHTYIYIYTQVSLRSDGEDAPTARGPEPADLASTRPHHQSEADFMNEFKTTPAQRARAHRASLRTRAEKTYGVKRTLNKKAARSHGVGGNQFHMHTYMYANILAKCVRIFVRFCIHVCFLLRRSRHQCSAMMTST